MKYIIPIGIIGTITIIIIAIVIMRHNEQFTPQTIASPNLSSAPMAVQTSQSQQQTIADRFGSDLKDPTQLQQDTLAVKNNEETFGLNAFDYFTGQYIGTWYATTNDPNNSITWTFDMINPTDNAPTVKTINVPMPSTTNVFWTLYPNHSVGVPTLRSLTTSAMSQWNGLAWTILMSL